MKRTLICVIVFSLSVAGLWAEEPQKFSPEKFQADMESFITKEAGLTEAEAAKFFPLLREMQQKQRSVYVKMKNECSVRPADEAGCKRVVQKRDVYDLELKKIQQSYHNKFFMVLPAAKVYDVITAEDHFHRRAFRNWSNMGKGQHHPMKRK